MLNQVMLTTLDLSSAFGLVLVSGLGTDLVVGK